MPYDPSDTDNTLENLHESEQFETQTLRLTPIRIEGLVYPINDLSASEKREVLETITTVLSLRFGCTEESITLKFI